MQVNDDNNICNYKEEGRDDGERNDVTESLRG